MLQLIGLTEYIFSSLKISSIKINKALAFAFFFSNKCIFYDFYFILSLYKASILQDSFEHKVKKALPFHQVLFSLPGVNRIEGLFHF